MLQLKKGCECVSDFEAFAGWLKYYHIILV